MESIDDLSGSTMTLKTAVDTYSITIDKETDTKTNTAIKNR